MSLKWLTQTNIFANYVSISVSISIEKTKYMTIILYLIVTLKSYRTNLL